MAQSEIANNTIHLTNVAIQKQSENFDERRGGKWNLAHLKRYLVTVFGTEKVNALFGTMQDLVIASLMTVQKVMIQDKHCFELYGYDILIDECLQPCILEVNSSPSFTANTPDDYRLKFGLLDDTLSVIDLEGYLTGNEDHIGGFDCIVRNGCKMTPEGDLRSYLGCAVQREEDYRRLSYALSQGQPATFPGYNGHVVADATEIEEKTDKRRPRREKK